MVPGVLRDGAPSSFGVLCYRGRTQCPARQPQRCNTRPMSDPATIKVVGGLVLGAVRQVAVLVGGQNRAASMDKSVMKAIASTPAVRALQSLEETIAAHVGDAEIGSFLRSPELREIAFVSASMAMLETSHLVETELVAISDRLLRIWVPAANDRNMIQMAVHQSMSVIIARGKSAPYKLSKDERTTLHDYLQLTLLAAISSASREGVGDDEARSAEARTLEERIRNAAKSADQLVLGGPSGTPRLSLEKIYVTPTLTSAAHPSDAGGTRRIDGRDAGPITIGLDDLVDNFRHAVILGDPGAGKTSLAFRLAHLLANRPAGGPVPVTFVLREYGQPSVLRQESISDFICRNLRVSHSIDCDPDLLGSLLRSGRIFVLFDGLDELIDTRLRREVRERIESFVSAFPSVRSIVTSRRIGYPEAPLDAKMFRLISIDPFSDEQVRQYVDRWFTVRCTDDGRTTDIERLTNGFLTESQSIRDLRSNPLILSLLCDLYADEGYLPTNRPDIYQKCSTLLFEKWDRHRNIVVPLPLPDALKPALAHLAYAMLLGDLAGSSGVSKVQIVSSLSTYLASYLEAPDQAADAAEKFVDFFTGRAWVFTDVGTTPGGEKIFAFTHRTFMEYFAAEELLRRSASAAELVDFLAPRLSHAELDVFAQLAVQMACRTRAGYDDKIFLALASAAVLVETEDVEHDRRQMEFNLLSFCCRASQAILLKSSILRELGSRVAQFIVLLLRENFVESGLAHTRRSNLEEMDIDGLVSPLLRGINAGSVVLDEIVKGLSLAIRDGSTSAMAFVLQEVPKHPYPGSVRAGDEFSEACSVLLDQHLGCFMEGAERSHRVAFDLWLLGRIGLEEAVRWHGPEPLLVARQHMGNVRFGFFVPIWMYVIDRSRLNQLNDIGALVVRKPKNLFKVSRLTAVDYIRFGPSRMDHELKLVGRYTLEVDLAVAVYLLYQAEYGVEFRHGSRSRRIRDASGASAEMAGWPIAPDKVLHPVLAAIAQRFGIPARVDDRVRGEMKPELITLLDSWAAGKTNLVVGGRGA